MRQASVPKPQLPHRQSAITPRQKPRLISNANPPEFCNNNRFDSRHAARVLSKAIRQELEKFFIATDKLEEKKLQIIG
jgi:hypothetical protein